MAPPKPVGLYLHIPFCARKCAYCDFASFAGQEEEMPAYVDRLTAEMAEKADIILAMDAIVYEQMEAIAPEETKKMHMFLGFANGVDGEQRVEEFSVLDPFDEDMDEYRACAAQLKCAAEKIAERLEKEITE